MYESAVDVMHMHYYTQSDVHIVGITTTGYIVGEESGSLMDFGERFGASKLIAETKLSIYINY